MKSTVKKFFLIMTFFAVVANMYSEEVEIQAQYTEKLLLIETDRIIA